MVIIGVALLLIGFLMHIHVLWVIGIAALVIGLVLYALGYAGRPIGGRRGWY